MSNNNRNTGTAIPGTGTAIPSGTGTAIPAGTGTAIPGGTGTAIPSGTGTAVAPGTGTAVPSGTGTAVAPGTGTAVAPGTGTAVPAGTGTGTADAPAGRGRRPSGPVDQIPVNQQYTINDITYTTVQAFPATSGEARVIIVENGGNKFCLKLYIVGHTPDATLLNVVKKAQGGFLINLRDHGVWRDPATGNQHYVEVMDYAPNGALDAVRITSEEQFVETAMRMAMCIRQCHQLNIVHRDVKPENFLCTSPDHSQFVLSDFGIARMMKPGKTEASFDIAKSGYFVSPEGAMTADNRTSVVGYATDFYSMGMTLLAMIFGVKNFYNAVEYNDLLRLKSKNAVVDQLQRYLKIGGKPMSDYAVSLLRGLLQFVPDERATFDDIKQWYTSRKPMAKGNRSAAASAASASAQGGFRVVFDDTRNLIARSPEELAKMMMSNLEYAKDFLYRGMAKSGLERTGKVSLAMEIDKIVERVYPNKDERQAGVYLAALTLDANMPFLGLSRTACSSIAEIKTEIWNNQAAYAKDLVNHGACLWAYFAARGNDDIKRLEATFRPIISRSGVYGIYALCRKLDPSMPFYSLNGKPLTAQKDIAAELWNNRAKYVKELANGDHPLWVYLASLGANGAKLAQEYPSRIRTSGEAELYSLCSLLDKDTPYIGKKQRACRTEKDLADELWEFLSDYKKELADPKHLFWKYLEQRGASWAKIAREYPALIAKDANVWAFELVYRLDATKPYVIQYADDNKWHDQHSVDDIIKNVAAHGITDFSLSMLSQADFQTWLTLSSHENDRKCGALLAQMVKNAGSTAKDKGWFFLYNFAPTADITLATNGSIASPAQIGQEINFQYSAGARKRLDLLPMLQKSTFVNSRLYQYMEARKMQQYIKGIQTIINIDKNISDHPSAPYNQRIAMWKVIQYLGHTPTYTLSNSKTVSTLGEIRSTSSSVLNKDINKGLAEYLTIFFHERKGIAFSFDELEKYYNFIDTYAPQETGFAASAATRRDIDEAISNRNNAWRGLAWWRNIGVWLGLAPLVGVLAWMVWMTVTGDASAIQEVVQSIGKIAGIITAIVGACLCAEGGCIALIIGGFIGYWVGFGIFYLLSFAAVYILALAMLIAAIYLAVKLFKGASDTIITDKGTYDRYLNAARTYKVCLALGTAQRTIGSRNINPQTTFENSHKQAVSYRKKVILIALGMVALAAAAFGLGLLLRSETNDYVPSATESVEMVSADELPGEYSGAFHGRNATMSITSVDGNEVTAVVTIQYSTPMTHHLTGTLNNNNLRFNVDSDHRKTYDGQVASNDTAIIYSGTYTNPAQGSMHDFYFTKK